MSDFEPVFFNPIKPPDNDYVTSNCMTAYSIAINSDFPVLRHDLYFVKNLLKENPNFHKMELLSLLYDFMYIIRIPLSNNSNYQSEDIYILAIRKLYAIGYYANQMFRHNDLDFIKQIPFLIQIIINLYHKYQNYGLIANCAVGYVLSSISYKYKDFKVNNPDCSIYFEIAELAVQFCKVPLTMPSEILQLFNVFFLNSLFSYTYEAPISNEFQILLHSIITMVTSALKSSINTTFNFIGLANHLIQFLNSEYYDMTIRYKIFNLIHLISHFYQLASDFIFDTVNLQIFAKFIAEIINDEIIAFPTITVDKKKPVDIKPPNKQLIYQNMIEEETFKNPIPILTDEQRKFNVQIHEPSIFVQYPITQKMKLVLDITVSLCSSVKSLSVSLSNTKLMKTLISLYKTSLNFQVILFVINWIKEIININSNFSNGVSALAENGIFEFLINFAFQKSRNSEIIKFICEFFPYILNRNPINCSFLNPLFQYFEESIFLSTIDSDLFNVICLCSIVSPSRVSSVFSTIFFEERLANILLFLRLQHLTAIRENSQYVEQIEKTRMALFKYIDILLSFNDYEYLLFASSKFTEALLQMIFENNIQSYVLSQIKIGISILTSNQPSFESIFIFFKTIYTNSSFLSLQIKILELISTSVQINTIEIAKVFLKTEFFDTLISFVQDSRIQSNVDKLLELFRIFSDIRGEMRKYIAEADLFSKLYVLIKPFFADAIDTLLMNKLWEIVFKDQNCDTEIREIKNANPLSLIFHLLEPHEDAFLAFIQFMMDCCERDINSTLEVNSTDFPSHLVQYLFNYRMKHSVDHKFNQVSTLFVMLSLYSIKGKDLLLLMQLLSALPGNFRPIFSMDILKNLLSLFQSPYDAPPSFVRISSSENKLYELPISGKLFLNEFSFYIDIEFSDIGNTPTDLFFLETKNSPKYFNSIRLVYYNYHISYEFFVENTKINGTFDYQFVPKRWTQIVIQYSKRKLQLFVHGKPHASINIPYDIVLKNEVTDSYVAKGLLCKIGIFFLSKTSLDKTIIELLNRFPRSFITTFSEAEQSEYPAEFKKLFTLNSLSLCLFNSAISYNGNIINLASKGSMFTNAQIFEYSPQAKDVIHVAGGVQSLLPLFEQLDMPLLPDEGQKVKYEFEPTFLPFLLQIFYSMLQQSPDKQEEFYQINGFGILGFLLTRVTLQHFSIQAIALLRNILNMLEYWPLIEQMIEQIFLNARIWIYFPKEVQIMVYQTIHIYFKNLDNNKKIKFAHFLPYSKVLHLMRVYFWSAETDKQICLLNGPKTDPITKEETYRRIEDMNEIRSYLWEISRDVIITFSVNDAVTLCTLCFDLADISLTVDTLTNLIMLIFEQNKILLEVLKTDYTFNSFFSLLVSPNELVRAQCIHIFVRFLSLPDQEKQKLLHPFSENEWISGIISTINMDNTTSILADVIYGYLFGLYPSNKFYPVPSIRVSQNNIFQQYSLVQPSFLPLALLSIANFDDSLAITYLNAISNSLSKIELLLTMKDWDHPFIMFLIHRIPSKKVKIDQASHVCLSILARLYSLSNQLGQLQYYIALFSSRSKMDFSHILRLIFLVFFDEILLINPTNLPHQNVYDFYKFVFEFMFLIPNSDPYYLPDFSSSTSNTLNTTSSLIKTQLPRNEIITFQDLYQIKYAGNIPDISYTYSTRTNSAGYWIDAELALKFLISLNRTPYLFTTKQIFTNKDVYLHPLFMYSFTLSNGLQHYHYFPDFEKYIHPLVKMFPKGRMENPLFECFVHLMAGLIRCCQFTEPNHQSYSLLFELSHDFNASIISHFDNVISTRGMTLSYFSNNLFTSHIFVNPLIQKQYSSEELLNQFAKKQTKSVLKTLTSLAASNAHYAEKTSELNVFHSSSEFSHRNDQLHYRLLEFSSYIRNNYINSMKQYRSIWRLLSSEGGPWHQPESKMEHHFKLDYSIHKFYTRGRLRENFLFNDHKDASLLRDEGKHDEAIAKYNEHLKKLRISAFEGNESIIQMGAIIPENDTDGTNNIESQLGNDDEVVLNAFAKLVTMKRLYSGTLMLTKQFLIFEGEGKYKRISFSSIKSVYLRRYILLDTSLEIYTYNFRSFFFDFSSTQQRNLVISQLKYSKLPKIEFIQTTAKDIQKEVKRYTDDWVKGKMSNFAYLMTLNILSGRTYNDLSQYPVFPWIIQDYQSKTLDLSNPKVFRDLSVPIGAYDEDRFTYLKEKMGNDIETHYHYGSFYLSSAVVIGYLIRVEPFTSLHIELQSGRFDFSDRLFHSIPGAWNSVVKNSMDFRELIPEFFYFPDFLINSNNFDLGRGPSHVELPPWASSASDFIRKNRAALESEYVTQHLNEWIDLTFGFKSRGPEAEKANNLFHPYFFDDSITNEVLQNPSQLHLIQEFAACFGQAPSLLFTSPHPSKKLVRLSLSSPKLSTLLSNDSPKASISVLTDINENEIIVHANIDKNGDITAVTSGFLLYRTRNNSYLNKTLLVSHVEIESNDIELLPNLIQSNESYLVYSFPYDLAFYIFSLKNETSPSGGLHIKRMHTRPVTSVAISQKYCAAGSEDCTIVIWSFENNFRQHAILSKHPAPVTCIAMDEIADLVVTCSKDGTIILSTLSDGTFFKSLICNGIGEPKSVKLTPLGNFVVCFNLGNKSTLKVFDQNLNPIGEKCVDIGIICFSFFELGDGKMYSLQLLRNHILRFENLPEFSLEWEEKGLKRNITTMELIKSPLGILLGTKAGDVLKLTF